MCALSFSRVSFMNEGALVFGAIGGSYLSEGWEEILMYEHL